MEVGAVKRALRVRSLVLGGGDRRLASEEPRVWHRSLEWEGRAHYGRAGE